MRLAQIARKVQVKPAEIKSFIKEKFDVELENDPNVKLDDEQVAAILEQFKEEEPEVEETKIAPKAEETEVVTEDEIDPSVETDIDALKEIAEDTATEKIEIPEVKAEEAKPVPEEFKDETTEQEQEEKEKAVVEIKHADPEEIAPAAEEDSTSFEEVEVDPDAEVIAAKVEQLEGIKVVGKIDLSEPEPEEEELPTAEAIEDEIDNLDGDVDTSSFPDMEGESDEKKDAIFAELDAQMDQDKGVQEVKQVTNEASEVTDNIETEEDSIYKNDRGEYRFTAEQKSNRQKSLEVKAEKDRIKSMKEKKKVHYEQNVASKVKAAPRKKKNPPGKKVQRKKEEAKKQEPKSLWQKFLNWLND